MTAGGTVATSGSSSGSGQEDDKKSGCNGGGKNQASCLPGCQSCCCAPNPQDVSPLLPAKPPAPASPYKSNLVKPSPGKNPPSRAGFLCSFLVDARGGAMTGHRHWGMRLVIPPNAVSEPTRINCKYQPLNSLQYQPPFMEREALGSRVIEISPALQSFRSPVLLEIPHFASNAGGEREIVVLRSNDGETWKQHICDAIGDGEIYQDVVSSVIVEDAHLERIYEALEVKRGRVVRVLTSIFPKYFAIVTRIREEVKTLEPEGGKLILPEDPRCRATFPRNAVHKKIKVGLQVQSISPELVQAAFGRSVDVSKMVAVEPRKRKFHQPIFISIPVPCNPSKLNQNNVRLICSMTGSSDPATWEDMTGTTPLEINNDVVHFSTKVSAIFWLVVIHDQQRDTNSALTLATRLYEESRLVPYMARISVFYRENFPKAWVNTLRIYCMTDDKAEKVVQSLQGFRPLMTSSEVEITEGSEIAVKLGGNILQLSEDPFTRELLPVSTIRTTFVRETFVFTAFQENALTILVQPKDNTKPLEGSLTFYRKLTRISKSQHLLISHMNMNPSGEPEMNADFFEKEEVLFHNHEASQLNSSDIQKRPLPSVLETAYVEDHLTPYSEEDLYEKIEVKKDCRPTKDLSMKNDESKQMQNLSENQLIAQSLDSNTKMKNKLSSNEKSRTKEELKNKAEIEAKNKKELEQLKKEEDKMKKKREQELEKTRKEKEKEDAKKRKEEEKKKKEEEKRIKIEEKKNKEEEEKKKKIEEKRKTIEMSKNEKEEEKKKKEDEKRRKIEEKKKHEEEEKKKKDDDKNMKIEDKKKQEELRKRKLEEEQKLKDYIKKEKANKKNNKIEVKSVKSSEPNIFLKVENKETEAKKSSQSLNKLFSKKEKVQNSKAKPYDPNDLKDFRRQFSSGQGVVNIESQNTPPVSPQIILKSEEKVMNSKAKPYDPNDLKDFRRQFSSGQGVVSIENKNTPPVSPEIKLKSEEKVTNSKAKPYDPNDLKDFRRQFSSGQGVVSIESKNTPSVSPEIKLKSEGKGNKTKAKSYDPNELKNFRRQFSSGQGVVQIASQTTPPMSPVIQSKSENGTKEDQIEDNNDVANKSFDSNIQEKETTPEIEEIEIQFESSYEKEEDYPNENEHEQIEELQRFHEDADMSNIDIDQSGTDLEKEEMDNSILINDSEMDKENDNNLIESEIVQQKVNQKETVESVDTVDTVDTKGYRHIPIVIEYTKDGVKAIEPVDKSAKDTKTSEETIITPYLESQEGVKEAEKKKSFIKEWQKELKEFFSIGDKKEKKLSSARESDASDCVKSPKGKPKKGSEDENKSPKGKKISSTEAQSELDSSKTRARAQERSISQSEEPTLQEIERSKRLQRKHIQEHDEMKPPPYKTGGKPKVVVPSPKGIPRPEPISIRTSNDSLSDDEFFVDAQDALKGRNLSIEDSAEFRKAVDSFDEIYRSESGHEICKSSTKTEKIITAKMENSEHFDALEAGQVKNVDGAARERKGSNKFAKKKQQSRPSSAHRNSIGSFEEQDDDSERVSPDLTTRLAETKEQMQRLDNTFRTLVDTEDIKTVEQEFKMRETKGHSLTRTVARTEDPLDQAIETMITKRTSTEDGTVIYEAKVCLFAPPDEQD